MAATAEAVKAKALKAKAVKAKVDPAEITLNVWDPGRGQGPGPRGL